jgi:hypothetical protein
MDFYYHPYQVDISAKKWMNFSNQSKFNFKSCDKLNKISPQWGLIREFIMKTDSNTIKSIRRHHSLQAKSGDYLRKLDLVDSHPNLFLPNSNNKKMTDLELEMLRSLVNDGRKRYMSKKIRDNTPSLRDIKAKKLEILN